MPSHCFSLSMLPGSTWVVELGISLANLCCILMIVYHHCILSTSSCSIDQSWWILTNHGGLELSLSLSMIKSQPVSTVQPLICAFSGSIASIGCRSCFQNALRFKVPVIADGGDSPVVVGHSYSNGWRVAWDPLSLFKAHWIALFGFVWLVLTQDATFLVCNSSD